MKIDVIGNGCTWTKELSTSYIINDEILFDVPQGSFKTLFKKYNLDKINYIIISHFHSDHFGDLHIVLDYIFNCRPDAKPTIIAPAGCKEKICAMFRLFEISYFEEYLKERVNFITLENLSKFKLDKYKLKSFKMTHANIDSYGIIIEENGVKVGFSGDTSMCNNVRKILKKSQACFIDSANIDKNNKHLSVSEVNELEKEFTECKVYRIHLSDLAINELNKNRIYYPKQGETIEIN